MKTTAAVRKQPSRGATRTPIASAALSALRTEYYRFLAGVAEEFRPAFEAGTLGAKTDGPYEALMKAVKAAIPQDGAVAAALLSASPNRDRSLYGPCCVESWSGALAEAVEVDLCVIAEARGWTKWKAADFFSDSGVRSVPVKVPRRAA